ncbi:TetR/AcrR family transcriptional regulator [Sphingomonas sp. QA11]|uniref:TetR/AcrR family transcriptional regulator n=1 Tax=Sphingomonas sp. QA11 TaxID=2950605 RepID=UPI00234BFAB5|nr:TetR/AcrR family transcriptional regulator [Sphingomonas sp. QA11]WCM29971.1 TetR/AcrR family transcriptional regulator [Sphingomonas sp. QA11]
MDTTPDRRTRKRMATRQSISDTATRLFLERGFDRVTVDEIAEAADVGRMTVFNHFPRKEDMFFDREQEIQDVAFTAVRMRDTGVTPIDALGFLAHRLIEQEDSLIPLFEGAYRFVETVLASEALKARARQMRDDFTNALAAVLAETVGSPTDDPHAHLAAGLIASTWSMAFTEAQKIFDRTRDESEARRSFLGLIDRGIAGTSAALAGTPYA